ncbi:MAG: Rieske 2Fe-2S domain-containing protein [Cytophagales bacterium]|jgi:nitrite reductase/ring-hydroxylating ferredoxin subunit|nr:Rieske 2Fe-2S domain-containing protein [Cytophagales bacterium]MCA6386392.1 Rieske 2Fe-2S domain-containing protein [Cytophagales bacterium]MCA6390437.1 Rieske 2Fe-2S domain-containing protein [Cytophagales bacterium]MCA6395015.1 Rieske 2Fe-2S domain-containing protein [Cytophagales bacterium]MCA6397925.1 Rieske 2Fe-2S domain-containing protein [Cytophagales bacterium]
MEWIKVFSAGEEARKKLTENKPQLLIVRGKAICLVMRDGVFYAVENKCSHNSEQLYKGVVNFLGEVVCPWHGYRFNIKTGREAGERSRDLITFPIKENDEGVFVAL